VPGAIGRARLRLLLRLNDARHEINQLVAMATAIDAMELLSEVY
jgi:hypothetical protein